MDAPPLPDDPREWPTDPFALLGVPRSVGETDLKRAYTRLIRKYKPEHAPEEFRRIREAYEAAVEMSRWYRDAPPVSDPTFSPPFESPGPFHPGGSSAPPEAPSSDQRAAEPHETQVDPPVRPARIDPVEDAWAAAVAGDWAAAYTALVVLSDAHLDRADLPLRLYWLLALRPTLDADRNRHDWLVAALTRARLTGPAVELYARELAADPHALTTPYLRLLELADVPADRVLAVARLRLAVADRRWAAVEVDLDVLARRAGELDEAAWLRYLTDVSAHATFAQTPATATQTPVAARCAALLAGLKHLELRHSWAFDRLDEQQAAARVWRAATMVAEPVRRAVYAAWTGGDWREPLAAARAWAVADPVAALRKCDQATQEGAAVLAAFARMVDTRHGAEPIAPDYPPALIRGLVRAFLTNDGRQVYPLMREALLQFLIAERIDPEELVAACAEDATHLARLVASRVQEDQTLRLVYRAACGTG